MQTADVNKVNITVKYFNRIPVSTTNLRRLKV